MEKQGSRQARGHVLALPYPSQGHVNPIFQFSKRLASKGLKATLAITTFISTTNTFPKSDLVQVDTISDGYDQGGFMQAPDIRTYLDRLREFGSNTLAQLIQNHQKSDHPITCVIYDAFLPWALDVAKQHGLAGAAFFTQPCAVNFVYYYVHNGLLRLPVSEPVSIPGMPLLRVGDMPSFISVYGSYPAYFELVLQQYSNADKADYIFVNTFYKLEDKVVDEMSKVCPVMTIGPTIPSLYLDKRVPNDSSYDLNLFQLESFACMEWLKQKPKSSVVYVSFGSMVSLSKEQMVELACGLKASNCYFLWTAKTKLPKELIEETSDKGMIVGWCPQLEVLGSEAVGCFLSHCGWNSTMEALSLGVAMVVMPQWTDQTTNAKLVEDVWRVGIRVKGDEKGMVGRDEVEGCIREVMEGDKGKELKKNSMKWRDLAVEAVSEAGSSDKHIDEFCVQLGRQLDFVGV